ncbi:MAG: hypothetical protein ACPG19_12805, partial [Saprospiraceae bacterium]
LSGLRDISFAITAKRYNQTFFKIIEQKKYELETGLLLLTYLKIDYKKKKVILEITKKKSL